MNLLTKNFLIRLFIVLTASLGGVMNGQAQDASTVTPPSPSNTAAVTQAATPAQATPVQPAAVIVYCPDVNTLVKDPVKLTWANQDQQWQGYDVSFENKLTHFIGAQWHGVQLGQVFCLYQGDNKYAFPVLLAFHALSLVPHTDSWGTDLGGYRDCKSDKQNECGFEVRIKPQETDIYQDALKLKKGVDSQ